MITIDLKQCALFHNFIRIAGEVFGTEALEDVRIPGVSGKVMNLQIFPSPMREAGRGSISFVLEFYCDKPFDLNQACLQVQLKDGNLSFDLKELIAAYHSKDAGVRLWASFRSTVMNSTGLKVLDLGGRARTKVDRKKDLGDNEVIVFDILSGDNVDVVGDAHEISRYFPENYFDAAISFSVFEHILMPWKLVVELNKILKPGAIGYFQSHQTLAMHDRPWDYWRFSDTAWSALFNSSTGYAIEQSVVGLPEYVIPYFVRPTKVHAYSDVGYELSAVQVRKTSDSRLKWDVQVGEVVFDSYPK